MKYDDMRWYPDRLRIVGKNVAGNGFVVDVLTE